MSSNERDQRQCCGANIFVKGKEFLIAVVVIDP